MIFNKPWEAVVLLPFIDIGALTNASETLVDHNALSEDEKAKNRHGVPHILSTPTEGIIEDIPYKLPKSTKHSNE